MTDADARQYRLTDFGREGLLEEESCDCRWEFRGKFVGCAKCGTIYGIWAGKSWYQLPIEQKGPPKRS